MKAVGIIAEYNPFHNGHLFHLEEAKRVSGADYAVVVMSGNFVQRGEPAVVNKYARTAMALHNGADLVLELPVYYATASAQYFAAAAIEILDATGIVEGVCFGSESGNLEVLQKAADILNEEDVVFQERLRLGLAKGLSFPTARAGALGPLASHSPNDILAIEYLRALRRTVRTIKPIAILRVGAHYHDKIISGRIASATAIRKAIHVKDWPAIKQAMPGEAFDILQNTAPVILDDFSGAFHYLIRSRDVEWAKGILGVNEGIENRIFRTSGEHYLLSEIVRHVKTKRYPFTTIQRTLMHMLLELKKEDFKNPSYIRVLGFKKESSHLLKQLETNARLPVVVNLKHAPKIPMLEKEIQTTDIYHQALPINFEYSVPLTII